MIIDDVRLPVWVERGASGGPIFNTQINRTIGGQESSVVLWSYPLHRWDIGYGLTREGFGSDSFNDIRDFFYARRGRGYGFRFKDWSDYTITNGLIGTGDGSDATWQVVKVYADGVRPFSRKITRLVSGIEVRVNGALKTLTTDYTVNLNTGVITFGGGDIPAMGEEIRVTCEFDVPVRFEKDDMEMEVLLADAASIPEIPVVEVRE